MFLEKHALPGYALAASGTAADASDPYQYQSGFGNHHCSEAIAGALPKGGTNIPQRCQHGLYPEHLNGTPFISPRDAASNVWMYRIRPGVAHEPPFPLDVPKQIESCFLPSNPDVDFTPVSHTWGPLGPDGRGPNFVTGLRTVGGHGDATLKEGLAVHLYAFDADMRREAMVNHDGDLLVVPQRGTLDIQTELGYLRVAPGEIAVIQAGLRFAVTIVRSSPTPQPPQMSSSAPPSSSSCYSDNSPARGYVLEVFGSHFVLPELGPLGANGLAHPRDFQYPVAAFDVDSSGSGDDDNAWRVTVKLSGRLFAYAQEHTPFDVVAWHGRYAPFKYQLARFGHLTANTDQLDPTASCLLTAPSRWPGVSLVDFCVFGERWAVAGDTIRIPYYHRTVATEMCGLVRGTYGGSVRPLEEGGLSFESAYMPHGESYAAWARERDRELGAELVGRGYLGFMFHIPASVGLTKWAREKHPDIRLDKPGFWKSFPNETTTTTTTTNTCQTVRDLGAAAAAATAHFEPDCSTRSRAREPCFVDSDELHYKGGTLRGFNGVQEVSIQTV